MCERTACEVLDCEVEGILCMLFLEQFNPEIDWIIGIPTKDGNTIPLVEHEANTSNSSLEIVSAKSFVKSLKQRNYI